MKKVISVILIVLMSSSFMMAQLNELQIKSLKNKMAKSDKDIEHEKKKTKIGTWSKRGDLFIDVYEVNTKYLAVGITTSQMPFLGITETSTSPYYGKANTTNRVGDTLVWTYNNVEITFLVSDKTDEDGNLVADEDGNIIEVANIQSWKDLKPLDREALTKSYNAFQKAFEMDADGKWGNKKSTKKSIAKLRDLHQGIAIDAYFKDDLETALKNMEVAIELYNKPREEKTDTFYNVGMSNYYAGIFAYSTKKYDKSTKFFNDAVINKYEIGTCYQYLAECNFAQGDTVAALNVLEKGVNDHPNEKNIIYALIDYYTPKGEYEKAFEYIDKAIILDPENYILYLVKADAQSKIYDELDDKYYENIAVSDQLKKDAYKERDRNPELQKEILDKKAKVDEKTKEFLINAEVYFDKSVETFELGISKAPESAEGYFSFGALYYNKAMSIKKHTNDIPTSQKERYNTEIKKYEDNLKLAMPQMEKAHEYDPKDKYALQILSSIYLKLGMYEKQKEVKAKIEEIKELEKKELEK